MVMTKNIAFQFRRTLKRRLIETFWRSRQNMNKKFIDELHKAMCECYKREHYGLISNLESWKFHYVETINIPELKFVLDKYDPESENECLVSNAFGELVSKGYLNELDWGFNLTEKGYKEGIKNNFQKLLDFFNKNPGAAIIISFVSLIVSIGALIFATS